MGVRKPSQPHRGFFAIGIYNPKTEANVGTLWRSAFVLGAGIIFTVGRRYKGQASDTIRTPNHIPFIHYQDIDDLINHLPHSCPLVGVEIDPKARMLSRYIHPERAAYLLGAEDYGLPRHILRRCHSLIQVDSARNMCLNVSVAGSMVMWHRHTQRLRNISPPAGSVGSGATR